MKTCLLLVWAKTFKWNKKQNRSMVSGQKQNTSLKQTVKDKMYCEYWHSRKFTKGRHDPSPNLRLISKVLK